MNKLLLVFMICTFVEVKEQSVYNVCFYRCPNNNLYVETILSKDTCVPEVEL